MQGFLQVLMAASDLAAFCELVDSVRPDLRT